MHSQHVAPGRKARPETTAPILRGRGLVLARAGWALLFALNLGLFAAAVPALHAQRGAPSARPRAELAGLGISEGLYAAYFTALLAVFGLGCLAVAAVIVYRRSDEPIALFASAFLALLGAVNHPNLQALATAYPAWASLLKFSWWTLLAALMLFVFLFPDGRFAPRWTRVPVFLFIGGGMFIALFLGEGSITEPPEAFGLILLGGLVAGVAAQIYRYLRVASPEGRQQTKWVVTAITAAILTQVLVILVAPLLAGSGIPTVLYNAADVTVITRLSAKGHPQSGDIALHPGRRERRGDLRAGDSQTPDAILRRSPPRPGPRLPRADRTRARDPGSISPPRDQPGDRP